MFEQILKKSPIEIKNEIYSMKKGRGKYKNTDAMEKFVEFLKNNKRDFFDYNRLKNGFSQENLKNIGMYLVYVDGLKTSQIRKILSMIASIKFDLQRIDADKLDTGIRQIQTLLIYSSGRHQSLLNVANIFFEMLQEIVDEKNLEEKRKKFENLYYVVQGIVAYHKFFGGREYGKT